MVDCAISGKRLLMSRVHAGDEQALGMEHARAPRDGLRHQAGVHAVAPEGIHVGHRARQAREALHRADRAHQLLDLAHAEQHHGAGHGVDPPGQTVEGAVGELQHARGEVGVADRDQRYLLERGAVVGHQFVDLQTHVGR
jgi:hypothetical protein